MYPTGYDRFPELKYDGQYKTTQEVCPMCANPDYQGFLNVSYMGLSANGEFCFCQFCDYTWMQNEGEPTLIDGVWVWNC